ncbi:MAG: hypothetical protein JW818_03450, partial [Pirellulales bacterium]|nr:hypothetical protein [Pirellulales bacterium]
LVMCGAAAAGSHTPRIIADVTQLPVHCIDTPDVSALGAAMIARSLVDATCPLDDISRQWTPSRRTITPNPNVAEYNSLRAKYFSILSTPPNY